jgi:hypothetical protein
VMVVLDVAVAFPKAAKSAPVLTGVRPLGILDRDDIGIVLQFEQALSSWS